MEKDFGLHLINLKVNYRRNKLVSKFLSIKLNKMECYLCRSKSLTKKNWICRDNTELEYFECNNCSLVLLSSFDHISDTFYEQSGMHNFADSSLNSPEIKDWLKETFVDDERRAKAFQSKIIKKDVLDFGCGTGGFLSRIKGFANSVEGVELERRLQPYFNKQEILVHTSIVEIPKIKRYDVITSFHVFEHLKDPLGILLQLAQFLKEDGELFIEVPSSDDSLFTLYDSMPFANFHWSQHLFVFNERTLSDLGKKAGLKISYTKQIQRYSIANHLYWLSKGQPGGHQKWNFIDNDKLHNEYESQLAAIGKCDTVMICLTKKKSNE